MQSRPPSSWQRLRRWPRFFQLSLRKAWADGLTVQSAALAFLSVVSLVPLLAAFSHFGARFFTDQPELISLLSKVLPYTETRITEVLGQFLTSSGSLTGLAFGTFLITALTAFNSIERVINEIWDVPKARSFQSRLSAFVVILCAGPILIAGGYSLLYLLETDRNWHGAVLVVARILPFALTAAALTLLNWQVPNTQVRIENALAGGLVSAVLVESLRWSFKLYVDHVPQISVVYGAFGVALLFMISIQAAWFIVLLGTEVAYCLQSFDLMTRHRDQIGLRVDWLGLFTLALVVDRFHQGQPKIDPAWLGGQLGLPTAELRRVVAPLVGARYLVEDDDDEGGWLLACDPHKVAIADVLAVYEEPFPPSLEQLPAATGRNLLRLRERLLGARQGELKGLMVCQLFEDEPLPAPSGTKAKTKADPKLEDRP